MKLTRNKKKLFQRNKKRNENRN